MKLKDLKLEEGVGAATLGGAPTKMSAEEIKNQQDGQREGQKKRKIGKNFADKAIKKLDIDFKNKVYGVLSYTSNDRTGYYNDLWDCATANYDAGKEPSTDCVKMMEKKLKSYSAKAQQNADIKAEDEALGKPEFSAAHSKSIQNHPKYKWFAKSHPSWDKFESILVDRAVKEKWEVSDMTKNTTKAMDITYKTIMGGVKVLIKTMKSTITDERQKAGPVMVKAAKEVK